VQKFKENLSQSSSTSSNWTKENKSYVVIIANGRFPHHHIPLTYLKKAAYIVCCDGAANDFILQGGMPDAIVGDCDSISEENKSRFAHILHRNPDQETNDLTKSVMFCVAQGKKDIIIIGGTGKREDHTIGNISLLAEYVSIANVRMLTNYGIFTPVNSNTTFESYKGEKISIFSINSNEISTTGLKFQVTDRALTNWWQGTLNESLGDSFSIDTSGRLIVFQVYNLLD